MHERRLRHLFWVILGTGALLCGSALVGPPASPDAEFSRVQVLGVLLLSLAFSGSCLGWGAWIASKAGAGEASRWVLALASGSLLASVVAWCLGLLGLISYDHSWLATLWVVGGYWLGGRSLDELPWRPACGWIPPALFGVGIISWLASATLANGGTDAFLYHLLGPRLWSDAGRIVFRSGFSAVPQASHWEYLFLWGNQLLGDAGGKGLISGQLFGQLVHVELGVTMASAAVYALGRSLGQGALWAWLSVLLCLCSRGLDITAFLAKNDYGCAGWALTGLLLLYTPESALPRRRVLALWGAGIFLGFALVSKVVLALTVGPALLYWALWPSPRKRVGEITQVACAVVAGMMPNLLRNWSYLGDPLYPFLLSLLKIHNPWKGPSADVYLAHDVGGISRDLAWSARTFLEAQNDVMIFGLLALIFPLVFWREPLLRLGLRFFVAIETSFVVYASWHFTGAFVRWLAPALFLNVVLASSAWSALTERLARRARGRAAWVRRLGFALPVALVYAPNAFDWSPWTENTWRSVLFGNSPTLMIRHPAIHHGGDAMAWLRLNAGSEERIATTGFRMLYYVSHLNVVSIPDLKALDEATFGARDPLRVVRTLREFGVRYVLDVAHWNTRFYAGSFGPMMSGLVSTYPRIVAYASPTETSFVVDLVRLEEVLESACVGREPTREWDWYS